MKYLALIFCFLTPCVAWAEGGVQLNYLQDLKEIKEIVTKGEIIAQMGETRNELLIEHKKRLWLCEFRKPYSNPGFLGIRCFRGLDDL